MEITWPMSGTNQVFENVPMDGFIRVIEGQDEFEKMDLPAIKF
jgi:hypothetical protein